MERKHSIDLLRIICALGIIGIHLCGAPVAAATTELPTTLLDTLTTVHWLLMWTVPVFFMITGYCLALKKELTYKYCFSHILKFVAALFTLGFGFAILERVFNNGLSLKQIGLSFLDVLSAQTWEHMWFVYVIIAIYLIMPIIHRFIKSGKKEAVIFTSVLFVCCILLPAVETYTGLKIYIPVPMTYTVFYTAFGALISEYKPDMKFCKIIFAAGIISAICIVVFSKKISLEYSSIGVCFMAAAIMLLFDRMDIKGSPRLAKISGTTWGVYLIHPLFINIILKVLKIDLLTSLPFLKLLLAFILIAAISCLTIWILKKIPIVKKIF